MTYDAAKLAEEVVDARARLLALVEDLDEEQLRVPYLPIVNPFVWELAHAAYFQEYWVLRQGAGQEPRFADADALFDSMTVAHEARWRLPLPPRERLVEYVEEVRDRTLEVLGRDDVEERVLYLTQYSVLHEDMHAEALTMTRNVLGLPPPSFCEGAHFRSRGYVDGDLAFDATTVVLGAPDDGSFCFDNEKWAHEVEVPAFAIAARCTTEAEFLAFVEDGGYRREELWTPEGWAWRTAEEAKRPWSWRRSSGGYRRRVFDRWAPLDARRAMSNVSWFEADAYARWAGRRLPTEAEWTVAARDATPGNLGWATIGAIDASIGGGPRQMLGNVWEWTATTFAPFDGFEPDMYADYSRTSFHVRKVLRGGSWATSPRIARPGYRNFFQPYRRDVFAGIRTCAR